MKLFGVLVLALISIADADGQSPSKILKQAEKALGGQEALRSVRSTVRSGTVERSDGSGGHYIFRAAKPNLLNIEMDLGGFEAESGFNGRSAWSRNSRDGLSTLTGPAAAAFQAGADFRNNLWLNSKADKSKLASGGLVKLGEKDANVVIITTSKGVAIKMYFDAASGLPVRDEVPANEGIETTDYSDYRKVGGTMQPYSLSIAVGDSKFEVRLQKIEINTNITRSEFDFPRVSNKPLPDLAELLSDVRKNEDRVEGILDTYAFTQKQVRRAIAKDGKVMETGSETFQMSFHKGNRIRRLIEKNGKPLSPKEQADADRDTAKRVEEIERSIEKQAAKATKGDEDSSSGERGRRISIAELLRASSLTNARRERFRSRDVIVFDFEPNPAYDLRNAKSMLKFFGKTAGVIWIDEEDKQVARIEAFLADDYKVGGGLLAKLRKGASFTLDQERVNNEIWLPSQTDINMSLRVLLVKGLEVNQVVRTYDYRKFGTEVKDATVNEVKKP